MEFGKKITTIDLLQVTLIHLKYTDEIPWHWLTVLLPWEIVGFGALLLHVTYLMTKTVKGMKEE